VKDKAWQKRLETALQSRLDAVPEQFQSALNKAWAELPEQFGPDRYESLALAIRAYRGWIEAGRAP
jgi:hypothetical protein